MNKYVPIFMYKPNEDAEAVSFHNAEIQYVCKSIKERFSLVSQQTLYFCDSSDVQGQLL